MTLEEQIEALNKKNKELLDEMAGLKGLKKTLDDLGGLDTIKSTIESSEEFKKAVAAKSNDLETVRAQLTGQITEANKKTEALKNRVATTKLNEKLKSVVTEQGGNWEILEPHLRSRVKYSYDEDQDDVKIDVLDSKGQNLMINGAPADLNALVGEFKQHDTFKKTFEINTARSGTGVPPSANGKSSATSNNPFVNGNLDEQTKLYQKNPSYAKKLMADAGMKV
jgi:hypothetical protein